LTVGDIGGLKRSVVSLSWFYKWISPTPTPTQRRRAEVDRAVAHAFTIARGLHGSPRLHADLREADWTVSEKTVADSMRRQGLVARRIKPRNGLTRQDRTAPKFPDLLKREFTAGAPNRRWLGDMTDIRTATDKLYLATVIDLYSRPLLGAPTGLAVHPAGPAVAVLAADEHDRSARREHTAEQGQRSVAAVVQDLKLDCGLSGGRREYPDVARVVRRRAVRDFRAQMCAVAFVGVTRTGRPQRCQIVATGDS